MRGGTVRGGAVRGEAVRGEDVPRWGAVSATAAPLLLVAGLTAASQLQPPRFDALNNTVSALAGQGANDSWVMTFTFVVVAACDIVTALALRPAAPAGRIVLAGAGFAGMMVAAFPDHLGGSLIHACWAGAGFGGLIIWPLFAWRRAPSASPGGPVASHDTRPASWDTRLVPWGLRLGTRVATSVTLAALTIWFAAEQATRGAQMGIAERSAGLAQTIWPLAVVVSCRWFGGGTLPAVEVGDGSVEPRTQTLRSHIYA